MTENSEPTNLHRSKAEQLLSRKAAVGSPPGVAELAAAVRGVGFALLAIQDELAKLRADAQQRAGATRR